MEHNIYCHVCFHDIVHTVLVQHMNKKEALSTHTLLHEFSTSLKLDGVHVVWLFT